MTWIGWGGDPSGGRERGGQVARLRTKKCEEEDEGMGADRERKQAEVKSDTVSGVERG